MFGCPNKITCPSIGHAPNAASELLGGRAGELQGADSEIEAVVGLAAAAVGEFAGESRPDPESLHVVFYVEICSTQGLLSPANFSPGHCSSRAAAHWSL